ncbi:helix-turn-helix transcriptional regulator [uncultured Megamonas sp.]|uniref:helix-turn-helix domain-containing protein n=1 Tax=uncultured Megamonas sp. TaxID=286140 RepID=UPI0025E02C4C|nr:helix-turn-helix transcriptional regulator [uncultured Megamonas sp.]
MESFKPILERIKTIKQEKGYTNEVLAQKSGIPLSTLNKILSSVIKNPKIGTLIAITDALDIDINSLIYTDKKYQSSQIQTSNLINNLNNLANQYNLNTDDISFINKYINLPIEDRHKFISLLKILSSDNSKDNAPMLTKPNHKLTTAKKHKIVEYEFDLKEKKQISLTSISSKGS